MVQVNDWQRVDKELRGFCGGEREKRAQKGNAWKST